MLPQLLPTFIHRPSPLFLMRRIRYPTNQQGTERSRIDLYGGRGQSYIGTGQSKVDLYGGRGQSIIGTGQSKVDLYGGRGPIIYCPRGS